jgi:hypothetical protein
MSLIHCIEALKLESAQVSDEQIKIANKIIDAVDDQIRNKGAMKSNGFEFSTNNTDPVAMFEANQEILARGYDINCQPLFEASRFGKQGQMLHVGYKLQIVPNKESIAAVKEAARKALLQ